MDDAHDIPDSTDWLSTPLSALATLENALHCQICKEFFDTPMITSCNHTFCSRCIRTAISADGQCPTCRAQDAPSKLRNNWQLQEVVAAFLEARPSTLKVARDYQSVMSDEHKRPGKRKRGEGDVAENSSRTTRSKTRRLESTQSSQQEYVDHDVEEEDVQIIAAPIDDGLVECPLGCGRRMKVEEVEPHLDRCEDERKAREKAARVKKEPAKSRPQDRLNELSYGMMKESQIAKKLRELGLRTSGNKQLLVKRHTAWVNMWNANCDSSMPKTKNELLRELDVWERTQGGNAPAVSSSIMKKDFDGDGWSKKNQDDFSKLIANARKSKAKAAEKKTEDAEGEKPNAVGAEPTSADPMTTSFSSGLLSQGPPDSEEERQNAEAQLLSPPLIFPSGAGFVGADATKARTIGRQITQSGPKSSSNNDLPTTPVKQRVVDIQTAQDSPMLSPVSGDTTTPVAPTPARRRFFVD